MNEENRSPFGGAQLRGGREREGTCGRASDSLCPGSCFVPTLQTCCPRHRAWLTAGE